MLIMLLLLIKVKSLFKEHQRSLKEQFSYDRLKIVPKDKVLFAKTCEKKQIDYFEKVSDEYVIHVNETEDALKLITLFHDNIKQLEVVKGNYG